LTTFRFPDDPGAAVLDLTAPGLSSELAQMESRLHVLRGLLDAVSRLDDVNQTIHLAGDRSTAAVCLQQEPFGYSRKQAEAILDMPMSWQTSDAADRLRQERDLLATRRARLRDHIAEVLALHWFG
jgi:DNA gyrase/topoisomerase IV subunit A